jgi:RNA-binding protein
MLTSKQRAYLRSMANGLDTILQVGKDGISPNTIEQVDGAIEIRELIKCRVLETCPLTAREAADSLAAAVRGEVVQVIGTRFVLFRIQQDKKKRKIELPKSSK